MNSKVRLELIQRGQLPNINILLDDGTAIGSGAVVTGIYRSLKGAFETYDLTPTNLAANTITYTTPTTTRALDR